MDAATALAADNLDKAKASLYALAKESTGEMKTLAQAAADTGDIAATRERFKALSVAGDRRWNSPRTTLWRTARCTRAVRKWVQKKTDTLANPYFGKSDADVR